jgi:hypothetical protein
MREILKTEFISILCMHSGHDGSSQFSKRNCELDRSALLRLFISILELSIDLRSFTLSIWGPDPPWERISQINGGVKDLIIKRGGRRHLRVWMKA